MKITPQSDGSFVVELSHNEHLYLANTLNEALGALLIEDCEDIPKAMGEPVRKLWSKIENSIGTNQLTLSRPEIALLCKATRACYQEFGDEEFSTRLGMVWPDALNLIETLERFLK